jgi:hypothetical protein
MITGIHPYVLNVYLYPLTLTDTLLASRNGSVRNKETGSEFSEGGMSTMIKMSSGALLGSLGLALIRPLSSNSTPSALIRPPQL